VDVEILPEPPEDVRRAILAALAAPREPLAHDSWWQSGLEGAEASRDREPC
jgi:hypothetical protein